MELRTGFTYQPIANRFMGDNNKALDELLAVKDSQYTQTLDQNLATGNFLSSNKPLGLTGENEYYNQVNKTYDNYINSVVQKGDLENMGYEAKKAATFINESLNPIITNKKNYMEFYEGLTKKESDGKITPEVKNYRMLKARNAYKLTKDPITGKVSTFTGDVGADLFDYNKALNEFLKGYEVDGSGDIVFVPGPDGVDYLKTTNGTLVSKAEAERSLKQVLENDPMYKGFINEQVRIKTFNDDYYALKKFGNKAEIIKAIGKGNSIEGTKLLTELATKYKVDLNQLTDAEVSALVAKEPEVLEDAETVDLISPYVDKLTHQKTTVSAQIEASRRKAALASQAEKEANAGAVELTNNGFDASVNPVLDDSDINGNLGKVSKGLVDEGKINSQYNLNNALNNLKDANKAVFTETKNLTDEQKKAIDILFDGSIKSTPQEKAKARSVYYKSTVEHLEKSLAFNVAQAKQKYGEFADETVALQIYKESLKQYPMDTWLADYKGYINKAGAEYQKFIETKMSNRFAAARNVGYKAIVSTNPDVLKDIGNRFVETQRSPDGKSVLHNPTVSLKNAKFSMNGQKFSYDQLLEKVGNDDFNDFWSKVAVGGRENSTSRNAGAIILSYTEDGVTKEIKVNPDTQTESYNKASSTLGNMKRAPIYSKQKVSLSPSQQTDLFGSVVSTTEPIEFMSLPVFASPNGAGKPSENAPANKNYVYQTQKLYAKLPNGKTIEIPEQNFNSFETNTDKNNPFVNVSQSGVAPNARTVFNTGTTSYINNVFGN